ncbi:MAG: Gfo/Idh/MocA family protein [Bryobacteraceae bacterium]
MKPTALNRRDWLRAAGVAAGPLALSGRAAAQERIGIAVIGVGSRGAGLLNVLLSFPEVDIPAVCDINEQNLKRALLAVEKARGRRPEGFSKGPDDYRRMLARGDFRAVLIATPQELHARMALDSMTAGKFVASEVPACTTLEDCWELVRTQRRTRSGYMLLENYRYSRHVMQVWTMAEKGVFGDLTYAECAYIHEIRGLRFNPDGSLTWRGVNAARNIGDLYPTHSLGPVCGWMGINRGDRLVSMVTMASKSVSTHEYAVRRFGKDSAAARVQFLNGDTNNTLIRTQQGRLIFVRYDVASPRPPGMGQYSLQGTRGAYSAAFGEHKVHIEGRSPAHQWEPLEKYRAEYEHPYWARRGAEAARTGHGGGDYFVLSDFLQAVRTGESPIDVYDAATWSSVRPLSAESLRRGSAPVEIPDFKRT